MIDPAITLRLAKLHEALSIKERSTGGVKRLELFVGNPAQRNLFRDPVGL